MPTGCWKYRGRNVRFISFSPPHFIIGVDKRYGNATDNDRVKWFLHKTSVFIASDVIFTAKNGGLCDTKQGEAHAMFMTEFCMLD